MRTKHAAVRLSLECWTWLAETGLTKVEWPRYNEIVDDPCHCPCCTIWSKRDNCRGCPLSSKTLCNAGEGTAYDKWDSGSGKKRNAGVIRDALAAWLRRHKEDK
jgi:hypothetical protein